VTEKIHDDVDRALAAYGGGNFSYRTFGSFEIHPHVPIVTESPPAIAERAEAAAAIDVHDVPAVPPVYAAAPAPAAAPVSAARIEPAFGPLPIIPAAPAPAAGWEPLPAAAPAPYQPSPLPPAYAPAYDPYFGRVPAAAAAPLRGPAPAPFAPGYPPRPPVDPRQPPQPLSRRGSDLNIFQLAWGSAAAVADGADRAGPRLAAKDGPQPGDEDLFRRL